MTRETLATSAQSLTGKGLTASQVSARGVCVRESAREGDDDDEEEREVGRGGGQEQKSTVL